MTLVFKLIIMIENPFAILERRFNRVESLLLEFLSSKNSENFSSPSTDYLTIAEACKRMGGISKVTLNQYTKTGRVKAYRIGGRVLYKPADIEAAMTAVKTKSGGLER